MLGYDWALDPGVQMGLSTGRCTGRCTGRSSERSTIPFGRPRRTRPEVTEHVWLAGHLLLGRYLLGGGWQLAAGSGRRRTRWQVLLAWTAGRPTSPE